MRACRVNVQCACARGSLMHDISQWINYTLCNFWFNSNITGIAEILLVWKIAFWNAIIYIYIYTLLVCLSVCLFYFVSNKRPHGGTNRAIILCGPSDDPGEGLWMIKISKKWASYKIRLSLNFENPRNF